VRTREADSHAKIEKDQTNEERKERLPRDEADASGKRFNLKLIIIFVSLRLKRKSVQRQTRAVAKLTLIM